MLSFQDLYTAYAADVYRFALWLAGDSDEAKDITSETFVRAWARHNRIRTETLKAYLLAIARNVYLQHQRKRKREVALEETASDPAPGPEARVEAQLRLEQVRRALQTVAEVDRAAFILRVQHQLPYAEIARVLGLSLSAAKVKVHRVRKRLLARCVDKEPVR